MSVDTQDCPNDNSNNALIIRRQEYICRLPPPPPSVVTHVLSYIIYFGAGIEIPLAVFGAYSRLPNVQQLASRDTSNENMTNQFGVRGNARVMTIIALLREKCSAPPGMRVKDLTKRRVRHAYER